MSLASRIQHPAPLVAAAVLAALTLGAAPAHAGPTAAADLDLGTSIKRDPFPGPVNPGPMAGPSPLYVVGVRLRAGWRFDLGPVWLLPELGGGYDRERIAAPADPGVGLPRAFGGARAGVSVPLAPALSFEPALYGHVGWARYTGASAVPADGVANDVGLSLDLRFLRYAIVGAQVGYEVVTAWWPTSSSCTPFGVCAPPASVALADRWVGYGIHAGVLF